MPSKRTEFEDTPGKREIVKVMISKNFTVSDICKSLGCNREELDQHYGDLIIKHQPLEHLPTVEDTLIVWRSVAFGMTQAQIAERIGVSLSTLIRYYRRQLETGKQEWIDQVGSSLVSTALSGGPQSVAAATFLLKTKAGWKETVVNELTGRDGKPIEVENVTSGAKELLKQKLLMMQTNNVVPIKETG